MYYDDDKYYFYITNDIDVNESRIKYTKYFCLDGLTTKMTVDEVISYLGIPTATLNGAANGYIKGTLYKNIDGTNGYHYYDSSNPNISVRVFFYNDLSTAVYIYGSGHKIQYYE